MNECRRGIYSFETTYHKQEIYNFIHYAYAGETSMPFPDDLIDHEAVTLDHYSHNRGLVTFADRGLFCGSAVCNEEKFAG